MADVLPLAVCGQVVLLRSFFILCVRGLHRALSILLGFRVPPATVFFLLYSACSLLSMSSCSFSLRTPFRATLALALPSSHFYLLPLLSLLLVRLTTVISGG